MLTSIVFWWTSNPMNMLDALMTCLLCGMALRQPATVSATHDGQRQVTSSTVSHRD
jgi:hypothetical protein